MPPPSSRQLHIPPNVSHNYKQKEMLEELMNKKDCKIIRNALLMKIFPSITIALSLFFITFLLSIFAISYGFLFIFLTFLSYKKSVLLLHILRTRNVKSTIYKAQPTKEYQHEKTTTHNSISGFNLIYIFNN